MEKLNRFTHIYGYLVCLISLVTFLVCIANFVTAFIDKTDPLHSGYSTYNLSSYEAFKFELVKSMQNKEGEIQKVLSDEKTMRSIYETTRQDKIDQVNFTSNRTIIECSILMAICLVLFITHWRIARRYIASEV